jgi:hypothetical protein
VKALYLDGRGGLDVVLDGPALRVHRPGRADGLYPLPRVARVVAVGAVRWHPDALRACLSVHKPVAVLDSGGRFVRVLFRQPSQQYGLARHLGELLAVPRFRERYARWRREAERAEMVAAVRDFDIHCRESQPDIVWQMVCREQHRRWGVRPGGCYRYLLGLAAAQIASAFALIGMPRYPQAWTRQEYLLFGHFLGLERWRQVVVLERVLARRAGEPGRRELTAAFEAVSGERDQRIAAWRQRALLEMMGVRAGGDEAATFEHPQAEQPPAETASALVRLCQATSGSACNLSRIAFGARGSLRTSVRIVRAYLEYDRRTYESHGTTQLAYRL